MSDGAALSLTGRVWLPRALTDEAHRALTRAAGLEPLFAPIVAHRGLESPEQVEAFLRPLLKHLPDPGGLLDMDRAVARLVTAVESGEAIAIFGDYDVDGATSTALLVRYFRALGVSVRVYIPDRLEEGYGPNVAAMRQLAAEGIRLVVTVDCGVTAFEALEAAADAGMAVIVTDHHQAREALPPVAAMVNPNRLDEPFPHKELAGVGVAFYLVMALNRAFRERGRFSRETPEPDLKRLLDLVALGTIADVASLTGINRPLVASGLRLAGETRHIGLRVLMDHLRLGDGLSAGQVGFQLGPRINAGGRLGQGSLGAELLMTEDPARAAEIVALLETSNSERRALEERIVRQAASRIEAEGLAERRLGLVVADPEWHRGVVGIAASRLADRFTRPAIVIAVDEQGQGHGSGRSIPGVNLLAAVEAAGEHLTGFGGHQAAAGLRLDAGNIDAFAAAFDQALRAQNGPELFLPSRLMDGELALEALNRELVGRIERLQPFGRGNPEPVFLLRNMAVVQPRLLKERHVKCQLADIQDNALEAIAFGVSPGPLGEALMNGGGRLDLLGTLAINTFRNRETVQMTIKDARPATI